MKTNHNDGNVSDENNCNDDDGNDDKNEDSNDGERKHRRPIARNCSFDYRDPHRRSKNRGGTPQIRFKTGFRNTVYDVMKKRGWKQTDSDLDWDIHWSDRECKFDKNLVRFSV